MSLSNHFKGVVALLLGEAVGIFGAIAIPDPSKPIFIFPIILFGGMSFFLLFGGLNDWDKRKQTLRWGADRTGLVLLPDLYFFRVTRSLSYKYPLYVRVRKLTWYGSRRTSIKCLSEAGGGVYGLLESSRIAKQDLHVLLAKKGTPRAKRVKPVNPIKAALGDYPPKRYVGTSNRNGGHVWGPITGLDGSIWDGDK